MDDRTANFDDTVNLLEKAQSVAETGEPEEVEYRKLNRHERRKRAKLARMLAVKERLEKEAKSSPRMGRGR